MRTTLTLDDDLASRLEQLAQKQGASLKQVVNETIRKGLSRPARRVLDLPSFDCGGAMPGINLVKANELSGMLEDEVIRQKLLAGK